MPQFREFIALQELQNHSNYPAIYLCMDEKLSNLERNILRTLFDTVASIETLDNSISDNIIVRQTQSKLKTALKGATQRCTCAKRTWGGPCELCQTSDNELVALRNFFRVIKKAHVQNQSQERLSEFIKNTRKNLT